MKAIYDVPAPAKLNLFLHITGRRADGYHLLQSVFMLIDWCDTLHFELRADGQISRTDVGSEVECANGRLPDNDLTLRAAKALQAACGTSLGVHISLEKRIPSQAGMGGGSSDAASCLLALQRLWGVQLPREQLMAIALSLGADVPFFLSGGNAWVEGIGELITRIELPPADFLVVKPPQGVATPSIFASSLLKRDSETATLESLQKRWSTEEDTEIFSFGRNDLQAVTNSLCGQIGEAIGWLANLQLSARMTGSGSAVFACLPNKLSADFGVKVSSHPDGWNVRKCRNLQNHPLAGW